jgi:hypothetical protein
LGAASLGCGGIFGGTAIEAKEGQATSETLLTAQTARLVKAAFDAGHGFAHFAHASEGGPVLAAGETQT